jgi:hypothetical protein
MIYFLPFAKKIKKKNKEKRKGEMANGLFSPGQIHLIVLFNFRGHHKLSKDG